jgi:4-amino-4-deoxy-L-arabinose transferase-like glycosyltransferase
VRPSLLGLLAATALLYLVDLAASGFANSFYSAAVEAGAKSWKAFFFGSFDSSNFITVDKPPASLWVMDLSARLLGVSAWSILVPQALEGIAAVGLLYATVRRRFSPVAGLIAGGVLAVTPVAALMFRFNNPDALLTLLLVAAAYSVTRALEGGSSRWLVLAGALVGIGFLAKMMQAFLVVPGFAAVYLLASPVSFWRRVRHLLASGAALVLAAGWWVAIVAVWSASSRPYIGGSQDNSILSLIFGYNGFGRITGNETGSVIGGSVFGATGIGATGGRGGMWGPTGITRLFGSEMGTQISWLLPAALVLGAAGLWWTRRAPRIDGRRAAILLWGSWLVVTGLVFSFAEGIIHPYYTVALAPAIGALVGIGVAMGWARRDSFFARALLAATLAGTAVWAFVLLERTPAWLPWLRFAIVVVAVMAVAVLLAGPTLWRGSRVARTSVLLGTLVCLAAAPAAYAIQTALTPHEGSLPAAGPVGSVSGQGRGGAGRFGGGGFGPGAGSFGRGGTDGTGTFGNGSTGSTGSSSSVNAGSAGTSFGPPPGGFAAGRGAFGPGGGQFRGGAPGAGGPGGGGALGGLLDAGRPSKALVRLLQKNATGYRWVAAVVGANSAAGLQLGAGDPVMAIGGFNGTDPTPTLAEFEADVAAGKIHYFVSGGQGGGPGGAGGSNSSNAIATWVADHYKSETVGGVALYDLTPAGAST